jgi:hypothetical protein
MVLDDFNKTNIVYCIGGDAFRHRPGVNPLLNSFAGSSQIFLNAVQLNLV